MAEELMCPYRLKTEYEYTPKVQHGGVSVGGELLTVTTDMQPCIKGKCIAWKPIPGSNVMQCTGGLADD